MLSKQFHSIPWKKYSDFLNLIIKKICWVSTCNATAFLNSLRFLEKIYNVNTIHCPIFRNFAVPKGHWLFTEGNEQGKSLITLLLQLILD